MDKLVLIVLKIAGFEVSLKNELFDVRCVLGFAYKLVEFSFSFNTLFYVLYVFCCRRWLWL